MPLRKGQRETEEGGGKPKEGKKPKGKQNEPPLTLKTSGGDEGEEGDGRGKVVGVDRSWAESPKEPKTPKADLSKIPQNPPPHPPYLPQSPQKPQKPKPEREGEENPNA